MPALCILAAFFMLWQLDERPLENRDEGIHAAVSLEMVRSGDWANLTLTGQPYFRKPPLKIWITSWLFESFGVDLNAVRLPSAISGILLGLLVGVWVKQWTGSALSGFLSGVALTSMRPIHTHAFRTGEMDGMLALFATCTLYAWWRSTRRDDASRWWMVVAGACMGTGFMAKSFPALLPLPVMAVHTFFVPRARRPGGAAWAGAAAAFLIIAAPWHVLMTLEHGEAFWSRYVGTEVINRVAEAQWGSPKPLHWYVLQVPAAFFPWSLALAPSLVWCAVRRRRISPDPTPALLLLWFALGFIAVSCMSTKAHAYLLMVYPAAIVLIVTFLSRAPILARDGFATLCGAAVVFCAGAWAPAFLLPVATWNRITASGLALAVNPWISGGVFVLVGACVVKWAQVVRRRAGALLLAILLVASLGVWFQECLRDRPATPILELIDDIRERPAHLICYRTPLHGEMSGWFHLLDEPGVEPTITFAGEEAFGRMLARKGATYVLLQDDVPLPASLASRLELVSRASGYTLWHRVP